jgi:multiple sugar transport system permease protein
LSAGGGRYSSAERRFGLALATPALIAIFAVVLLPLVNALILSFQQRDLARPQNDAFVGLDNYIRLATDERFLNSLKATTVFSLTSIAIELPLAIAFALVLTQAFRGRGLARAIIILPWALPAVVAASMWKWIYNADFGALNAVLLQLGLIDEYQVWLADPNWAMGLIILANVWKETPLTVLLLLGALMAIPTAPYEAARIDGASAWQRFRYVTFPLILPILIVAGLLQLIWGFQTFEIPQIITGGGPQSSTELVSLRIYSTTFRSLRFGLGAAMAYSVALLLLVPAIIYIRKAHKSIVEM